MFVSAGFDGSSTDDFTVIRVETMDYWQFTPTYGDVRRPTVWAPQEWGGVIPRAEVHAAVAELFATFQVCRFYCDPRDWQSEIQSWALEYGEKRVLPWVTGRLPQMHAALERFKTDLTTGLLTHDDCPITKTHIANARKVPRPGEKYLIGKPHGAYHQRIDAAMASVLAHEAACDAVAAGENVEVDEGYVYVYSSY